jgi:hypothetical protein
LDLNNEDEKQSTDIELKEIITNEGEMIVEVNIEDENNEIKIEHHHDEEGHKEEETKLVYEMDINKKQKPFLFIFPRFPNNYQKTTKYTWWSFIPQNFLEQLFNLQNIYFIIVMILSFIPGVKFFQLNPRFHQLFLSPQ